MDLSRTALVPAAGVCVCLLAVVPRFMGSPASPAKNIARDVNREWNWKSNSTNGPGKVHRYG